MILRQSLKRLLPFTIAFWAAIPFWSLFSGEDMLGKIVIVPQIAFFLFGGFVLLSYFQTSTTLNGKQIIYKVGSDEVVIDNLKELYYKVYSTSTSSTNRALRIDVVFVSDKGDKFDTSYFAYNKNEIREFINLCLQAHPDCIVIKPPKEDGLIPFDIEKYL